MENVRNLVKPKLTLKGLGFSLRLVLTVNN
jgi:hypothetical protein